MVEVETLDIMAEIEALVSDKLQVVSYKWLSRNCSVSSNDAKRLLQEFAEKHGSGLEVIYSLSGWLKNNPSIYHIKLVSAPKLADVKKEFEDNCSIQVYSVQACIPKDPATLWNAEFVQTEELFDQPSTVDNCLRDNRFCGVFNSFVKRNANGSAVGISPQQPKIAAARLPSRSNTAFQAANPKPHQGKLQQESPKLGQSSDVAASDIKSGNNAVSVNAQAGKPHLSKEKDTAAPVNKNKAQSEKISSVNGGSLANLWGRASAKAKPVCAPSKINEVVPNTIVTSAEAQICAHEAIDDVSSDEDGQTINHKRTSNGEGNRKRRVVLDFSDEEDEDDHENAVNLASPDPPKMQSNLDSRQNTEAVVLEKKNLNFEEQKGDQLKIKQEKSIKKEACLPPKDALVEEQKGDQLKIKQEKSIKKEACLPPKDALVEEQKGDQLKIKQEKSIKKDACLPPKDALVASSKSMNTGITLIEKNKNLISVDAVDTKDKVTDATSSSLKRRKVLKTRIDERGREVTEVVWEGEEPETKKNEKTSSATAADNRPPAAKKSPALGSNAPSNSVSKAGAKKAGKGGGVKDAKQGNILSFFKRA